MGSVTFFVLCSFVVAVHGNTQNDNNQVTVAADRPSMKAPLHKTVTLECCYTVPRVLELKWLHHSGNNTQVVPQGRVGESKKEGPFTCTELHLRYVGLNDTGLYRCIIKHDNKKPIVSTHGTFLQVYKPMEKTINISESAKNKILTAEGILLLLCVLLPSASLLCKSKRLHELEKRKMNREEENIYQGLNLDDCCSTYDQILRSQVQNPYQDVDNVIPEEEDIQLEKP